MKIQYTLPELSSVAQKIINNTSSKVLLFYGEMGVGKTTLIKEICSQLGVTDPISSPTYSIVNEYQGKDHLIYHFDFYRIEDEEEAYAIGFEEYAYGDQWVFIEWPERIANLIPNHSQKIEIVLDDDQSRILTVTNISE